MTMQVTASLKDLSGGAKWRGHFDGVRAGEILHGWTFLAANPAAPVALDLYIHDVHLASISTEVSRPDIDRLLNQTEPMRTGFWFNMSDVLPQGALDLLRKFGCSLPKANLRNDLRICIAGTQHRLPGAVSHAQHSLDLQRHLPVFLQAAATQLRSSPTIDKFDRRDQEILLAANPLFSSEWYASTHGEVALCGIPPVEHFIRLSSILEREPGPWFDTAGYLAALQEGPAPTLPAIIHYGIHGHDSWWPGQGRFRAPSGGEAEDRDHAVLIHLYHLDTVPDLQMTIGNFPKTVDVFITVPEDSPAHDPEAIAQLFPRATEVMTVPNQGQDVAAFLEAVRRLKGRGYRFFCKLHSKKGNKYPETWRRVMFDAIAATPARVAQTVDLFRSNPKVLMAGPEQFWLNGSDFDLGSGQRLRAFAAELGFGENLLAQDWGFFAGTCFWIDAELASLISDAVSQTAFTEVEVERDGQTAHAVERLFSLVATSVGGQCALLDGTDWMAPPVISLQKEPKGLRMRPDEDASRFLTRVLRDLAAPKTVAGTAALARAEAQSHEIFGDVDMALHRTIDVIASCWMSQREPMHEGLANLHDALVHAGLTSAMVLSGRGPVDALRSRSCDAVLWDGPMLTFPANFDKNSPLPPCKSLPHDVAIRILKSECLFRGTELPENSELDDALARLNAIQSHWRAALTRHKVKMFLIWGNTAPKSRLFIHLCTELGIEYQIIERGHFPGTLSIDPIGQFGSGALPRLVSHMGAAPLAGLEPEDRFRQIRAWYEEQQDHAAYAQFQKRGTRDLEIIARARAQNRPVILVIGGNDQGGGVVTPDADPLRVNWFGSSDQAFTTIRGLVASKFPDALLVLRPHPSQSAPSADFVLVARETAMDDLIDAADVCVTIATTASAVCLLKDKPLLTLGLSELNGRNVGIAVTDETHFLAALRQVIWSQPAVAYPNQSNRTFIIDLFDHHLIGVDSSVPTRHTIEDLARLLVGRIQRMKTGFLQDYEGREDQISQAMYEDVRNRGRAIFTVDRLRFAGRLRPSISLVLPIYGDYEGTRICFEQLARHQAENGYRVITIWDRGPDVRLRDLCLEYVEKAGFTYLENNENVGFSGTVNSGILYAGRDDVILLNSDTIPCGDWALRLQDAAYAHPKLAAVVPFSNNATIYNVPFPTGEELPLEMAVNWVEKFDNRAKLNAPRTVEMPISHGFCTYIRRCSFDRIGLFSESKFDKGHGEDNEFSMRARAAGYFCGCAMHVFVGHAGSTSFAEDATKWKLAGRGAMQREFSHYFEEIRDFYRKDPFAELRLAIV